MSAVDRVAVERELRAAANEAVGAARSLAYAVTIARDAGVSWDRIAVLLTIDGLALGERFPNGTSITTMRRFYGDGR